MSEAIRFMIQADIVLGETIGELFEIEGSAEKFAVHHATPFDYYENGILFCATHVETGLRIGKGDSIDQAINAARDEWRSKTPEQIEEAIRRGTARRKLVTA